MTESQVMGDSLIMGGSLICDLQTCQEFASCKTTGARFCAEFGGMIDNSPESNQAIGRRLKATREALGYEQQNEFAKTLGLAASSYNLFETGQRRITLTSAQRMRRRFGVSLDWVYCGDASALPSHLMKKLAQLAA